MSGGDIVGVSSIPEPRGLEHLPSAVALDEECPADHEHDVDPSKSCQPELLWQAALDCNRCARAILLLLLDSAGWVGRRVERIRFRDDQTAERHTSVDLTVPRHAPRLRHASEQCTRLVPLTMMRRKTLVNFSIDDSGSTPLSLLGMRHGQQITYRMIEVLAEVTEGVDAFDAQVRGLARNIAFGTQQEMCDAVEAGRAECRDKSVKVLLDDPAAGKLVERLSNNFVLLVALPDEGPPRRIVRYHYDEPLSLTYKRSGYDPKTQNYPKRAEGMWPFSPARLAAALGVRPTVIRFPIPAAELCRSYHFEVEAPKGVTIDRASLAAGRPNETAADRATVGPRHSWDQVVGGFPLVGLHACDVPSGSRSRAQVHLRLGRRGWLTSSLLASVLSTGLLWAMIALAGRDPKDAGTVATALLTVVAAVVVFVMASSEHAMASRLVTSVRKAAVCSVFLLLAIGTGVGLGHRIGWLELFAAIAGSLCFAVVALAWLCAKPSRQRISPWEQGLGVNKLPQPLTKEFKDLDAARRKLGFERPAVMVESSEGDNRQTFTWTSEVEHDLVERLCRWTPKSPSSAPTGNDEILDVPAGQLPVPVLDSGRAAARPS